MVDEHYLDPRLAELYNLDSGWNVERDFYVNFVGPEPKSVLDVGCGTGLVSCRLALAGHSVVGADPAMAMLDVGRRTQGGDRVAWHNSTIQDLSLDRQFERIIMTGNAFQVLLSESDLKLALSSMRRHLQIGGLIAFETRNPDISWRDRWNYDIELDTDFGTVRERRVLKSIDWKFIDFVLLYDFGDETLQSESRIRLWSQLEIELHVANIGLKVRSVFGDWESGPLIPDKSETMIFILEVA